MTLFVSPNAQRRRDDLVDGLIRDGHITDPRWERAFRAVAREAFVTRFAVPDRDGRLHHHDDPAGIEDAVSAIYTDASLLTRFDTGGTAVSSSTAPSLMAIMLHLLDASPGHRVLEIGTGTGYNAALLAHVLGDEQVTSVDLDPTLVADARSALRGIGLRPHVAAVDGRLGYPDRAPYDRIVATCGLDRVPPAWPRQVRPGGLILVNLSFALVLLTVHPDGGASGRFGQTAAFMSLRPDLRQRAATAGDVLAAVATGVDLPAQHGHWHDHLTDEPMTFLRALAMPGVQAVTRHTPEGPELLMLDPATGSWTAAARISTGAHVRGQGPRHLHHELTELAAWWDHTGRPAPHAYGLTVAPDGRHTLWLDNPDSRTALPLPHTGCPPETPRSTGART